MAKRIESTNMRESDLVISINEALRQYTISMGAPAERTPVIKAGIDLERFNLGIDRKAARQKLQIAEKDLVMFFMGWLYEFSGLRELAEELRKDPEKYKNLKLLIIGKGDLWGYLSDAAEKDLKESMILLPWQPYEEIPWLIAASDICVLPAHKNGIMQNIVPIKMYEYMAMSKPVIATDLKGLRMEFAEGNGVLYIDNPEEALGLAMNLSLDGGITREGLKARLFVEHNDWDRITMQFENTLAKLVTDNQ